MKKNESKQKLAVIRNIFDHAYKKSWECVECGCSNPAINSHLLQRHGILDNITENDHAYEVRPGDMMKWDDKIPPLFLFKLVGIQQAISLKVFCSEHDNGLFYDIEHGEVDFDDYRVQLLFSYRSLCAEIRKKEINKEINKRMRSSSALDVEGAEDILDQQDKGYDLSLRDLSTYRDEMKSELVHPTGLFTFKHYSYPSLGIYASSSFSYDEDGSTALGIQKSQEGEVWDCCFIQILPLENSTEIIVGYSNNHTNNYLAGYTDSWGNLDNNALGVKLTDLFAGHIEGWGLAPSLYHKLKVANKLKYCDYMREHASDYQIMQNVGFNLFEDCFEF